MVLHQCSECNKSFKDVLELYYHIENHHRQIPIMTERKCPKCESKNNVFEGKMFAGNVSPVGEIKHDEEYVVYRCSDCASPFKIKQE